MAAPFSISKILGVIILFMIIMVVCLPMIQLAFAPPATQVNATGGYLNCATANTTGSKNEYNNSYCLVQQFGGVNASLQTNNASYLGNIFNLTHTIAFPTNTSSSNSAGFFAPILQFTGLSFVFSGIGTLIQTVESLGSVSGQLLSAVFGFLPGASMFTIVNIIKLLVAYVALRMIILGVSAWMKYSIFDS